MLGRPRVKSTVEQLEGLQELARPDRRDEADRAHAVVLSINGWTSGQIARILGATPDSVWRWRSWFAADGVEGLRAGERLDRKPVRAGEEHGSGGRGCRLAERAGSRPVELDAAASASRDRAAGRSDDLEVAAQQDAYKMAIDGADCGTASPGVRTATPSIARD